MTDTRTLRRMPTPVGVGAGQTAACNLPLGSTYERLYIRANVDATPRDVPEADWGIYIDEIRLMVDGDAKIQIDAATLVKLNKFHGRSHVDGVLDLYLSRPWMRTIGGEDQTAYGTLGLASLSLEMDIKAGVTVNSLTVFAETSAPKEFGPHRRIQKFIHNQGVVGTAEIADIPRGAYAMSGLYFATDQIGAVEVIVDNRKIHDSDKAIRDARNTNAGRVPQGGLTAIDFHTENRLLSALPMALQDFRVKADFTATGSFAIFAESIQGV